MVTELLHRNILGHVKLVGLPFSQRVFFRIGFHCPFQIIGTRTFLTIQGMGIIKVSRSLPSRLKNMKGSTRGPGPEFLIPCLVIFSARSACSFIPATICNFSAVKFSSSILIWGTHNSSNSPSTSRSLPTPPDEISKIHWSRVTRMREMVWWSSLRRS